jgi:RNA polymerase sigma-70 factor, ECF subfamily
VNAADEFEAFVRRHQDMVFGTAVRLLGNPADAEDIAQAVFLKAYQRFDAVRASESPAAWLRTVARNACLNHLTRYRNRWRFFSELARTGGDDETPFEVEAAEDSIAVRLEHADEHERLEAALRALPEHQRVPLVLFHFEDLSYQQIADALRVSLGKVKTDIHRGREALRIRLTPDTPTDHASR